jgi:hypothetical protein
MITHDPRWSLPRGNTLVPSRWQATAGLTASLIRNARRLVGDLDPGRMDLGLFAFREAANATIAGHQ